MHKDVDRVLFDETAIRSRLRTLAERITADYLGRELTVLAILNGSLIFAADLLRHIPLRFLFNRPFKLRRCGRGSPTVLTAIAGTCQPFESWTPARSAPSGVLALGALVSNVCACIGLY